MSYEPLCELLPGGGAVKKGEPCTAAEPQLCYKTCGPGSVGFKSETCTAGLYVEGDCEFPADGDYACYAIPATQSSTCPAEAPKASDPCTVDPCNPCSAAGMYRDSKGDPKTGYCVCSASGSWTCASATAWPCPGRNGCTGAGGGTATGGAGGAQ